MSACITGWAHTRFGRSEAVDAEALIAEVAGPAIADAGLEPADIDAVFVGAFNNGFGRQDFLGALVALAVPELRHVPAMRVENACATGSAAIHAGLRALESRSARHVLVVGVEKMTATPTSEVGEILLGASYHKQEADVEGGFAGVFAGIARAYFQKHGDKTDSLARIAAKNHHNGAKNPYAHMRKALDYEFCRQVSDKNPLVADPLRRSDCSLISDGAAAVVLTDTETALRTARKAVHFRAAEQVNDYLPLSLRTATAFEGAARAWSAARSAAGVTNDDLSFVETHDCFTIAELIEYEAMGLAEPGDGARVIDEGISTRDGRLPVNPSGGLKSKGHPIGATGVSQHVMAAMQLCGDAGEMQLDAPELAGVFNMGGAAVANYVSILERLR
ncbi:acetyl-CoA acetyltransferase [Roseitalea porphyridii]|uniref:Thiolase domain-containing protein n=1 Tax=Roseitalea porphyridii TaxID=1852022 RepID=A0A4P6V053_9HYPH|nr:acetyl-CoA acetyltransferase [Roseitalea porphyridii]QBK29906.1 thiolase domain-containing protein [Roseitalea porphyridii]